jgi:transcriptional regulator with XRE-family HTH domain
VSSIKDDLVDLGSFLKEQRHGAKLSLRQLADLAGVSNPYLSQIERGLKKPSADILQSLAKGLRISAESLYVRAGILDEQDAGQVEVKAAILGDLGLNERQKRVLLDIYESFCSENARSVDEPEVPQPPPPPRPAKKTTQRATAKAAKKAAAKTTSRSATKATARTTRTTTRRSTS